MQTRKMEAQISDSNHSSSATTTRNTNTSNNKNKNTNKQAAQQYKHQVTPDDFRRIQRAMCSIDLAESCWSQELPHLPVPDLWLTVSRYLASLKSILAPDPSDEINRVEWGPPIETLRSNRERFERTTQLVHQFMLYEGPQLQRDLKEYASKHQNWATEFWLEDMYLSNPLPLPVNSNPFFLFPRQHFNSSDEMLMFATRLIQFAVDFKYRIDQQTLRQDYGSGHGKGKPLCMETYRNFFHSYRMPHEDMDRLLPQSRRSNHIVIASCNQFYILRLGQDPLDDPYKKDSSVQLNSQIIFDQLLRIYRVSREHARRELVGSNKELHNNNNIDHYDAINDNNNNNNNVDGQLKSTCDEQQSCNKFTTKIPKIGLFTGENRKVWAKIHKKLIHCERKNGIKQQKQQSNNTGRSPITSSLGSNIESLRLIEDCLFVLCLDSLVGYHQHQSNHDSPATTNDLVEKDELHAANVVLTGAGSHLFTANRWFDKFLQIIVGRDGICGINIEHSASEGITVLRFIEEFLTFIEKNPIERQKTQTDAATNEYQQQQTSDSTTNRKSSSVNQQHTPSITSSKYVEPKSPRSILEETDKITPLSWTLDEDLEQALRDAELNVNALINNFSLRIYKFNHFGRDFIKNQNLSPDAFIQLAMQYTFFKIHGHLVSTYESASLRQFRFGRVDNIRANTCEAYDWIQCMLKYIKRLDNHNDDNSSTSQDLKLKNQCESLFIKAITKQVEILRYTIIGSGPDNHLLALKKLAQIRYDDDLPELFVEQSYRDFLNFRLSTSQLPNNSGVTVGYGAVVPDGYGCSYNPCDDRIIFCVSTFHDCPITDSDNFVQTLEECLLEMQRVCLARGT